MKKYFTIVLNICLSVLIPVNSFADSVPLSRAKSVAGTFFSGSGRTKAESSLKLVWDGRNAGLTKDVSSDNDTSPYYVFSSDDDGFVIISGDDCYEPVLGYSFDKAFDPFDIPGGLAVLLEGHADNIRKIRRGEIAPSYSSRQKWDGMLNATRASSGPAVVKYLKTAEWSQANPYYLRCPVYSGQYTMTGCGATAISIVMKYHEWPDCGYGTVPQYTTSSLKINMAARTLGHYYDWDNMLDDYSGGHSSVQDDAVAVLMADVGHIIKSDYGLNATSAYSGEFLNFIKYMKYSPDACFRFRKSFKTAEWIKFLKNDINAGNPVIVSGISLMRGGHSYVIDGYDSEDYFHFNWGWGGVDNGYFYVSDSEFSNNEQGYFGLSPDRGWVAPSECAHLSFFKDGSSVFGLWSDTAYAEDNVKFTLYCSPCNSGTDTYSGILQYRLRHSDGTEKVISETDKFSLSAGCYYVFAQDVTISHISEGDEIVVYCSEGDGLILVDNGALTLPLRYSIPKVVSVTYYRDSAGKYVKFSGKRGMTCRVRGCDYTFETENLTLSLSGNGSEPFILSNGHDSYSVTISW